MTIDNSSIIEELVNSVATVYKWKDYYLPDVKKVVDVDKSILEKYVGKYDMNGTSVIFKMSNTDLAVNVFGDLLWKVYFTSDSEFFIREFRGYLKFQTDKDNKVTGFIFNGMTAKKTE
jgi:hypothetical protein